MGCLEGRARLGRAECSALIPASMTTVGDAPAAGALDGGGRWRNPRAKQARPAQGETGMAGGRREEAQGPRASQESPSIGIVLFDDVEELDFAGPWEVFAGLYRASPELGEVFTVAEWSDVIQCAKGLRVLPEYSFADAPPIDVLLVPGGQGTRREVGNAAMIEWLRKVGEGCRYITSVCTGALLLHEAGFARGRRVTTHWAFVEQLRARGEVTVLDGPRYVRDGNLVTAAGVSAGIDMALWLVGQLHSPEVARRVQRGIQYDPAPPYAAEV